MSILLRRLAGAATVRVSARGVIAQRLHSRVLVQPRHPKVAQAVQANAAFAARPPFIERKARHFATASKPTEPKGAPMSKTAKIGVLALMGIFLGMGLYASEVSDTKFLKSEESLIQTLHAKVLDVLSHSKEIPGLKADEFDALKPEIAKTMGILVEKGVLEIDGTDKDVRPVFVALQGVIEHVLSCQLGKDVLALKGIIHTPMPATPFCTEGVISEGLVDPSIENDAQRLFTVKARTTIVRDFLHRGGVFHIVYPKAGLAQRTDVQQAIYKKELGNYPSNLFDHPLNAAAIPEKLIGATCLFTDRAGKAYAFGIEMRQAKDPKEKGHFGLWFGSLENENVKKRVGDVVSFIAQDGSSSKS